MKILQITDDLPPAVLTGSGRIAWETSVGLKDRGHKVEVLTAAAPGTFADRMDGIVIHTIPTATSRWAHYRSVFSGKRAAQVMAVINKVKPDVIHAHGVAWQMGYRWIRHATAKGIPVVFTAHGTMHIAYGKVFEGASMQWWTDFKRARWEMNPFRNPMIRSMLSRCGALLAVSDALRDYMQAHGYPQTTTLHNGIDLNFWKETVTQADARSRLKLDANAMIFLIAGRMGYDKGADAIVNSLPENAMLIVAGEVPPHAFDALGNRVRILPKQTSEEMRLLYCACDVSVVPSVYLDPFPTVCLEAMACSRAVVATTQGGAKEAVEDGVTGWTVDPRNVEALRKRLEWCRDHRTEMPTFGKAGRVRMEKFFSRERYLNDLEKVYSELTK
jgi:glycosyltransferase involved in cell wall biosynthesis